MKTILVLMTVVFALTFGLAANTAWADDPAKISEVRLDNGITYSDTGLAPDCESVYGIGAGGLFAVEPAEVLENRVTFLEPMMPDTMAIGKCAGAIGTTSVVYNGVTVFEGFEE